MAVVELLLFLAQLFPFFLFALFVYSLLYMIMMIMKMPVEDIRKNIFRTY
jgi:hypothetical protein